MEPDSTTMEPVLAAAARYELGALLDSWRPDGILRRGTGEAILHRFEHGLVVPTRQGPLALQYRDLRIFREHQPTLSAHEAGSVTRWRFERSDGQVWETVQGDYGKSSALAQVYEHAVAETCARQREVAVQRLGEGATLAFGPVELDRSQMTFGGKFSGVRDSVPWTRVIELLIPRGTHPALFVRATREGRFLKRRYAKVAEVAEIPNFPLLWELAHLARANTKPPDDQASS